MAGYQLYGGRFTRALIVQMVMAEGGIGYDLHEVDIIDNEHRSPEFLALNPAGYVPVLIMPDGTAIAETPAINLYLADHHGLTHLAPSIDEPERARFLSDLFFLSNDLEPILKHYFYPHQYVLRAADETGFKQKSLQDGLNRFAVIEQRLREAGPYHLGERFSLLDIVLGFWAEVFSFDLSQERFPAILNCLEQVSNRPLLRSCFDELIEWNREYRRMMAAGEGVI